MENNIRFIKSISKINPLPVAAVNLNQNVELLYSNGIAEKLLGYSADTLASLSKNNFETIVHPEDFEEFQNKTLQLLQSKEGESIDFNFRVLHADGHYLNWTTKDIVFERDLSTGAVRYASVIQDITKVVKMEKQLSELVEKLDAVSHQNAHNLRGPVATILGLVELMEMESIQSDYNRRMLEHLKKTVTKLDGVIREISNAATPLDGLK